MTVIDAVGFRIMHRRCSKCGSDNIEIGWRCEKPEVISYKCLEKDCGHVEEETPADSPRRLSQG